MLSGVHLQDSRHDSLALQVSKVNWLSKLFAANECEGCKTRDQVYQLLISNKDQTITRQEVQISDLIRTIKEVTAPGVERRLNPPPKQRLVPKPDPEPQMPEI